MTFVIHLLNAGVVISFLIPALSAKSDHGVAVLIDEFDTPLIESLDEPGELKEVRKVTQDFYKWLKAVDKHISFIFATGVSKASSLGLFSSFNTAVNVTRHPDFGAALGFTQEELEVNFGRHIDETAQSLGLPRTELLSRMSPKYDDFCFDGRDQGLQPPFHRTILFQQEIRKLLI